MDRHSRSAAPCSRGGRPPVCPDGMLVLEVNRSKWSSGDDVVDRRVVADRQPRAARVTGEGLSLVVEMEPVHDTVHERGQHE
jgi:hypothetical protein